MSLEFKRPGKMLRCAIDGRLHGANRPGTRRPGRRNGRLRKLNPECSEFSSGEAPPEHLYHEVRSGLGWTSIGARLVFVAVWKVARPAKGLLHLVQ